MTVRSASEARVAGAMGISSLGFGSLNDSLQCQLIVLDTCGRLQLTVLTSLVHSLRPPLQVSRLTSLASHPE